MSADVCEQLAEAFYGHNPNDYATGPADLIPLITIDGAEFCVGSNTEGHPDSFRPAATCKACGVLIPTRHGRILPHWALTVEGVIAEAIEMAS